MNEQTKKALFIATIVFAVILLLGSCAGVFAYNDYRQKACINQYCEENSYKIVSLEQWDNSDSPFRRRLATVIPTVYKVQVVDKAGTKGIMWFKFGFLEQMEWKVGTN